MWLFEAKLKVKTAHFRLPSASQKRVWFSRDADDTGNERKFKHGDGSLQFGEGLTDFCANTIINMEFVVSVSFWNIYSSFWLDLCARKKVLMATEH